MQFFQLIFQKLDQEQKLKQLLTEKISSEKIRGFILKNLQRNPVDNFTWKLNASSLLKNLEKIMEGIDLKAGSHQPDNRISCNISERGRF